MVSLDAQKLEEPSGAEDLEVLFWTCRMSDGAPTPFVDNPARHTRHVK
jgi:hypothetical protein